MRQVKYTRFLIVTLWVSIPIWILLSVDIFAWYKGWPFLPPGVYVPGFLVYLLFNPTWEGLHNYRMWQILLICIPVYYLLVLLIVWLIDKLKKARFNRKEKVG